MNSGGIGGVKSDLMRDRATQDAAGSVSSELMRGEDTASPGAVSDVQAPVKSDPQKLSAVMPGSIFNSARRLISGPRVSGLIRRALSGTESDVTALIEYMDEHPLNFNGSHIRSLDYLMRGDRDVAAAVGRLIMAQGEAVNDASADRNVAWVVRVSKVSGEWLSHCA